MELLVYADVLSFGESSKFWVNFCQPNFLVTMDHKFIKNSGWHFFGRHLGLLAAILKFAI